ncbi:hypothetical protein GQ43DRAFT_317943 [Delitschia confertaspora ATCC 74209]|uniref:G-protein coupled receptors family 1 profile domain-containing protein n=1 Tax=Delitschia confertaspora ATCC 74209 TaxID=1513339 RepID=A0A9P4MWJ7_9PLEO|nr:hypothetical protein GQ43DRAFT_317943 [Delitschia confertaspora ATCC 74209]
MASILVKRTYFAYPNSLDPLPAVFHRGLVPVGLAALLSLASTLGLLIFITHRLVSWRKHYKEYVGYNQYVLLIYNLLLADLQQSLGFVISFHWLRINKILAPTVPCFLQGWFIHLGDVSSGFFVLAIAIHTWLGVVKGYKIKYIYFVGTILAIWAVAVAVTVIGPIMHGNRYFTRAGGWCWVSQDYENERLWLHYIWIFIIEFGTILIYLHIFIHLRGRLKTVISNDTSKLSRATKFMLLYPMVYVVLTLPLAIGRMVAMTHHAMPDIYYCAAGTLLTSCGWMDALLYTLTRRVLVSNQLKSDPRTATIRTARERPEDHYGLQSMSKANDMLASHTVTITGGRRLSRIVDSHRPRHQRSHSRKTPSERSTSPTGSTDSIIKLGTKGIGIVTETNIEFEPAPLHVESDRDSDSLPRDPRSPENTRFGT